MSKFLISETSLSAEDNSFDGIFQKVYITLDNNLINGDIAISVFIKIPGLAAVGGEWSRCAVRNLQTNVVSGSIAILNASFTIPYTFEVLCDFPSGVKIEKTGSDPTDEIFCSFTPAGASR